MCAAGTLVFAVDGSDFREMCADTILSSKYQTTKV